MYLLNVSSEGRQVKRAELIVALLSETCSPLSHQPEVPCLLVHGLTAQVDNTQTSLGHLQHCLGCGEHRYSLNLRGQHGIMEVMEVVMEVIENYIVVGSM